MAIRDDPRSDSIRKDRLHMCRKLFLQYVLDAWITIEGNRLHWIRTHQKQIRAENYAGLVDFVARRHDPQNLGNNQDADLNVNPGRRIILPSTHRGSVRHYREQFNDMMAINTYVGYKCDLFITFTCNPNWPEITENLRPGELIAYRPDLEVKVFHEKFSIFRDAIMKKHILGRVKAAFYVIEFQKRG